MSAGHRAGLIDAVRSADQAGEPVLLIGGGSNLVISDAGFPGTVIHVNTRGLTFVDAGDGAVDVTVAAGADWDDVVAATVAEGLAGLEPLSGIPGRAGATPIQNVGAYGREVAEVITQVRVYDRQEDQIRVIPNEGCRFSYRTQPLQERPAGSRWSPWPGDAPSPGGGPAPVRGARRNVPAGPAVAVSAGEVCRAGGRARRRDGGAGGGRRGPRRRHQDPLPQGHGPQPRRPRHPQRRLLLHQPGDHRRGVRRASRRPRPPGGPARCLATRRARAWSRSRPPG